MTGRDGSARAARGAVGHAKGLSAEAQVRRRYEARGAVLLHERWRGQSGEIDLIFRMDDEIVFVEVKASRTHARAALRLRPAQARRLCLAAEEFLGTQPAGSLTPMRLDVALVDETGRIDIVENALMDF